jgi:hypothetical protein
MAEEELPSRLLKRIPRPTLHMMNYSKKGRSARPQRGGETHLLHSFNPFNPSLARQALNQQAISWTVHYSQPTLADFFSILLGITIAPPLRHAWTSQT